MPWRPGPGGIRDGLTRRAARLELDADAIDDWVDGRMRGLSAIRTIEAAAADADLVIEAAIEDLAAKRAIFVALDRAAPSWAVLATNTSALSVTAIGGATSRPGRVIGLHFFNPAPVMRLVEIVTTGQTEPAVAEMAVGLMARWGRTPVRSADAPGFIVNRVNRPFTLEPLDAIASGGATVAAVDHAMRAAGYPMGPFELMDLIGLDVNLAVTRTLFAAALEAGDPLADRFRPSPIQERLVAEGHLGRKGGGGFYPGGWVAGEGATTPSIDPLAAALPERVELATINEAYRVVGDGVATVADVDLALRLGAGHPLGPFERVARLGGPGSVLARLRELAHDGPRFVPAPALVAASDR